MADGDATPKRNEPAIPYKGAAALVAFASLWPIVQNGVPDALSDLITIALGVFGVLVAIAIWRRNPVMFKAYCIWALCWLSISVWTTLQHDAATWKIAVGIIVPAFVLFVIGSVVHRALDEEPVSESA